MLAHLTTHGCRFERKGGCHSVWINPATAVIQAVPRHKEIKKYKYTARSISQKLGAPYQAGLEPRFPEASHAVVENS